MKKLALTALVVLLAGCTTTQGTNNPSAMNGGMMGKSSMCPMSKPCCCAGMMKDGMMKDGMKMDGGMQKPCCCKTMCTKPKLND